MLSAVLTAAALCQSCVGDVAPAAEEPSEWMDIPVPPIALLDANALASDKYGTIFLGGDRYAPLWRSIDRGRTWTQKTAGLKPSCEVTALLVKGGRTVFAALHEGGVFVSRDHGETWIQANNHLTDLGVQSLAGAADGAIIAGTHHGRIFRSSNDGGVWVETTAVPFRAPVLALVADSAGTIYAGNSWQGVFFSADSGRTWTPSSSGLENLYVRCLAFHGDGYILAGTNGGIFRSAGGGEPWIRIDSDEFSAAVLALATDRSGTIFAGTDNGAIRSRDGGDSWERADIGLQGLDVRSFLCADDVLLAGTTNYGVFRSTDGGTSWSSPRYYFPDDPDLYMRFWLSYSLSIDSCGAYYLFNSGLLVKSRDGGETWIRACRGIPGYTYCLAIHPNASLLAGTGFGIFISNDSGDSWSRADTFSSFNPAVRALEVAENGVILGRADNGVVRSSDGGASWEKVFNESPVTSIGTGSGGSVYIGTEDRGVLGSTDYGDTWRRITDSTRVWSIDADRVGNVFVLSEDGILCSGDGGNSWKTILPGGDYYECSLVAAPDGEVAALFDDEGTLYISDDCFSSWKTVSVPFVHSSLFLSPDGHLFFSDKLGPGLHRSRNTLF